MGRATGEGKFLRASMLLYEPPSMLAPNSQLRRGRMGTNPTGCTEWERDFDPATEKPMEAPICKVCGKRHWSRMCSTGPRCA